MSFFLLFISSTLLAELFQTMHPKEPGFYHVKILENGEREFTKFERSKKVLGADSHSRPGSNHPTSWDFRTVTGSKTVRNVFDQGSCGGCWAFSTADVTGAALFLNEGIDTIVSPQYMIDCHAVRKIGGYTYEQGGCNGGYPVVALADIEDNGLPNDTCIPWEKKEHSTCPAKCKNGGNLNKSANKGTTNSAAGKRFDYVDAYKVPLQDLKDLVTTSGPCIAEMLAYDDLSSTTGSTVYTHNRATGTDYEGHAVTVYGFGILNGVNYWLIKNSWGSTWADGGYFKIKMGTNESGIENNFYSLYDNDKDYNLTGQGGGGPVVPDTNPCEDKAETPCKSVEDCQWFNYPPNAAFCDYKDAACNQFQVDMCNETGKWGLPDCVPGKYTCVDPNELSCVDLTTNETCLAENDGKDRPLCRWYTNGAAGMCDAVGIQCARFNATNDQCGTASKDYELNCVINEDNQCVALSTVCRVMDKLTCQGTWTGPGRNCHWYSVDGYGTEGGFCDVNEARCSWFDPETCETDAALYGMECKNENGLCSYGWKIAVPAAWTLLVVLLIGLFL